MAMPEESLINDLYDLLSMTTPTDKDFYLLGSYFIMSAISSNNVSINMPYGKVKTNLWVLLVGPSTVSHKSTLLDFIFSICNEIEPDNLVSQEFSPEGLFEELDDLGEHGGKPVKAISISDEMSGFIQAVNKKDYMANIKELLMQLYDGKAKISRKLRKQKFIVREPYYEWLTATSEQMFLDLFKLSDIANGFLARFIITKYNRDNINPKITKDVILIDEKRKQIVQELIKINKALKTKYFEFYLTPSAMEKYINYVNDNGRHLEEYQLIIKSRLSTNILKIAVLNYIAENYNDIVFTTNQVNELFIDDEHIDIAIQIIERYFEISINIIDQMEIMPTVRKLLKIIKDYGIIYHSELLRRSHLKASEFRSTMDTMIEAEMVYRGLKKEGNKPITYYTLMENIEGGDYKDDKPVSDL